MSDSEQIWHELQAVCMKYPAPFAMRSLLNMAFAQQATRGNLKSTEIFLKIVRGMCDRLEAGEIRPGTFS